MQRLHEWDLSGHLLEQGGYEHLCLPMEFTGSGVCGCVAGPRTYADQLLYPQRFPREA
jgi:hypothetical protein